MNLDNDKLVLGQLINQASVVSEFAKQFHRRAETPDYALDLMASILFDPRDEDPLREGESHYVQGYRSPLQKNPPQDVLDRAKQFDDALNKDRAQTWNMGADFATLTPDVYELMRKAAERSISGTPVFYMARKTYEHLRSLRARFRRRKRRARYRRGKLGIRPRRRWA